MTDVLLPSEHCEPITDVAADTLSYVDSFKKHILCRNFLIPVFLELCPF